MLRDGLTADAAAAMLFALASPHVHQLLRRDQGWDVESYRDWLTSTIATTVLRDS